METEISASENLYTIALDYYVSASAYKSVNIQILFLCFCLFLGGNKPRDFEKHWQTQQLPAGA